MDAPCPSCGAPVPTGTAACPSCGTKLEPGPPVREEALLEGLEELTAEADGVLVEELESLERIVLREVEASDRTPGELAAVESRVASDEDRLAVPEADLMAFVRRVERGIAARAKGSATLSPSSPPKAHPLSGPTLLVAALLFATGVFLYPIYGVPAALLLMAALGVAGLGAGLRLARAAQ